MSERSLRRRHHSSVSSSRKPRLPASPSPRRQTPQPHRHRHEKHNVKASKVFKRCVSEPMMWRGNDEDDRGRVCSDGLLSDYDVCASFGGILYRPHTCTNVFASSPTLMSSFSPHRTSEGYNKEAKVVVNVTVEGSPGPVKTLVKLGSSVDDTIKTVIDKYNEQGRTPKLDKTAKSSYELHLSYFSLQSLQKSELIGDVGSRSFYLRKSGSNHSINGTPPPPPIPPPPFLLPSLIARKISKIVRRTRRLWKVLLCWK